MIQPTVVLTEYDTHERYEAKLQPQERFASTINVADGSFQALAFRTRPVLGDPTVASGLLYMLRPGDDGICVIAMDGADFEFDEMKLAGEQGVAVSELEFTGQLVIKNRLYGNNKMSGIAD